jgi:DNA-directed RNA polymerase specialized sigma24 family protein
VFELRYFGGMSVEEVAEVLCVSEVTIARDWKVAKLWLRREIARGSQYAV